ncbi:MULTISPECIES: helix-turn-helix domain-containing protein [unclassified Streptomyces]|uniref:helix-turn-helix domain-containing protein n=1 Tax=unclassified Streptomyces TaxID=2593676 RepID=UPI002E28B458|nr:helix-turn-helix transcriptional regulator [Streptomyces sp. NBC_00223]
MANNKPNAEPPKTPSNAKRIEPEKSPRALYGAELRFKREQAGLSRTELGEKLFMGASQLAKIETGERRVRPDNAEMLDRILKTDGFFVRNLAAGRVSKYREHFADVVEIEALALTIREWEPSLVPGLLQTEAYALAVIRGYDPVLADALVRERLAARLSRAVIFNDPHKPLFWAVVGEAAIRCQIGGAAVMAGQLRHIAAMIRRNRIVFQVLPFSAGANAGLDGSMKLMTTEDDAPVVYFQGQETGALVDDPATVKRSSLTYDLLGATALSPDDSLTLIEAVAEEYEHGVQVRPDGGHLA